MNTAFSVFIAPDLWNAVDVFMENPRGMWTEYRVGDTFIIESGKDMEPGMNKMTIPSYDVPELAIPFVIDQANKALASSRAASSLIQPTIDAQRDVNADKSAKADGVLLQPEPVAIQSATIYTLRIDVTVPHAPDGQPDYSPDEIVNRVDAALRYVPGDCVVTHQELWRVGPQTIDVFGEFGFGKKVEE